MSSSPTAPGPTLPRRPRRPELNADRARQIDRYIDYFGGGTTSRAAASLDDQAAAGWAARRSGSKNVDDAVRDLEK